MEKCPWCGGSSGYMFVYWTKYTQLMSWNGDPIDADSTDGRGGKTGECIDCHRRFFILKLFESAGA